MFHRLEEAACPLFDTRIGDEGEEVRGVVGDEVKGSCLPCSDRFPIDPGLEDGVSGADVIIENGLTGGLDHPVAGGEVDVPGRHGRVNGGVRHVGRSQGQRRDKRQCGRETKRCIPWWATYNDQQ